MNIEYNIINNILRLTITDSDIEFNTTINLTQIIDECPLVDNPGAEWIWGINMNCSVYFGTSIIIDNESTNMTLRRDVATIHKWVEIYNAISQIEDLPEPFNNFQ